MDDQEPSPRGDALTAITCHTPIRRTGITDGMAGDARHSGVWRQTIYESSRYSTPQRWRCQDGYAEPAERDGAVFASSASAAA